MSIISSTSLGVGGYLHHLSGQLIPILDHPFSGQTLECAFSSEKILLDAQPELPLVQIEAICSCLTFR